MNNLGITKQMGRAALKEMETEIPEPLVDQGLRLIGWGSMDTSGKWGTFSSGSYKRQVQTALAFIAAIAGVEP